MIEILIIVFVVGFIIYYMIRHPLRSIKRIGQGMGLFVLGILGLTGFIVLAFGALTLLKG